MNVLGPLCDIRGPFRLLGDVQTLGGGHSDVETGHVS